MNSIRSRVKENARVILRGNWFKAIMILFIIFFLMIGLNALQSAYAAAFNIPDTITVNYQGMALPMPNYSFASIMLSVIFTIFSFVLITPLTVGQNEWYWYLTDRKPVGIEGIFAWFGSLRLYAKSLWLRVNIFLRTLPWVLLLIGIPYCIMFIGTYFFYKQQQTALIFVASFLIMIASMLLIGGLILYLYIVSKYFLAVYLLVEDNKRKVNDTVSESVRLTQGLRGDIFKFWLSFTPWFLLIVFFFPILYVMPYFNASSAVYAKYLIYSQRIHTKEGSQTMEFSVDSPDK